MRFFFSNVRQVLRFSYRLSIDYSHVELVARKKRLSHAELRCEPFFFLLTLVCLPQTEIKFNRQNLWLKGVTNRTQDICLLLILSKHREIAYEYKRSEQQKRVNYQKERFI